MVKLSQQPGYKNLCIMVFYLMPVGGIRQGLNPSLKIIEFLPGMTIGGLYAARYGRSADESISEFALLRSYAEYRGRKGFLLEHFMGDKNGVGEECGKGQFSWDIDKKAIDLEVANANGPVAGLRVRPLIKDVPFQANFPFLCMKGENVVFTQNHFISKLSISTTTVRIPEGSPLRDAPLRLKLLSSFWETSNVIIKETEYVPKAMKAADNVFGNTMGGRV
jgi:hypothetical protein